jgi:signal transduction histidine kinase
VGTTVGLFRLEPKRLKVYSRREGLENDDTQAVMMSSDGTIWVGTAGGISAIRPEGIINLPPRNPDAGYQRCGILLADSQHRLWAPDGFDPLRVFTDGQWSTGHGGEQLRAFGAAKAIYEDHGGRIWLGTDQGVACKEGETERIYTTTDGLSCGDVRIIYEDRTGDMWFGTFGGGLNRLHNNKITAYRTNRGQYNNRSWCIHEDADGVFWVGSEDGLNRFVPPDLPAAGDRFFTFTTQQGLGENVVNNVQEDDLEYLWLSGLRGIYRISRAELNDVASGRRTEVRCAGFGEADGMLSSECNGGDNQPAGCKDREGRIWFPTAKGVVVVDPRQVVRKEVPPPVVIEQVLANDEVVYGDRPGRNTKAAIGRGSPSRSSNHKFKPGSVRALEIHYTANSLTAPEKVRFRHRLKGYDVGWREAGDRRVALYTNLRPGDYCFEVTAANAQGLWSVSSATFPFSLEPYFWQTWPFYILCSAAVLGLAAATQAYRLKWQHRLLKLEEQRALANERARIARDLHDDLGTALTGLALRLDVARREAAQNPPLAEQFTQSAEKARDLADRMREVVWTINPRCDTVSGLATFLEQQVAQFLQADGVRVRLDFPEDIPEVPLGAQGRHQLALSVREALTNVVRHAHATEVVVSLIITNQELVLQVKDNGCGFHPAENAGHGLSNMRIRMEQVGGQFECSSGPGLGTLLRFRLPLGAHMHGNDHAR